MRDEKNRDRAITLCLITSSGLVLRKSDSRPLQGESVDIGTWHSVLHQVEGAWRTAQQTERGKESQS